MVFVTIRRVFCLEVSGCQCVRVKITDSGGDEPATNLTAAMEVTTITGSGDLVLVLRQVPLFSGKHPPPRFFYFLKIEDDDFVSVQI
ncbi:hypothetical protein HanXRQr2_Chr09g0376731 [Helianthus annuus]|uniref:Uncharacterized protein n=1 Tax=Helianthus annuus TaxID=4232 RepID=A0A9K3I3R1_HELAN|nr:hypothetical protein HanXRQr2_Chr09g0376731 [Helianthus annuus]KAJ0892207.1 hypothetical protein HanPSC8_Chr09g0363171 [Helianthus annuus]